MQPEERARNIILIPIFLLSASYTGLDYYRMMNSRPEDHVYPIFYVLTVIWCGLGIITTLACSHFMVLKIKLYIANSSTNTDPEKGPLLNTRSKTSPESANWMINSASQMKVFTAILLCISCFGFVIDSCFYHLEGDQSQSVSRGLMMCFDVIGIILYTMLYHTTLIVHS